MRRSIPLSKYGFEEWKAKPTDWTSEAVEKAIKLTTEKNKPHMAYWRRDWERTPKLPRMVVSPYYGFPPYWDALAGENNHPHKVYLPCGLVTVHHYTGFYMMRWK